MYCTRCGKQIDYDAIVCNECLEKEKLEKDSQIETEAPKAEPEYREVPRYQYNVPEEEAETLPDTSNPRMFGFGSQWGLLWGEPEGGENSRLHT